MPLSPKDFTFSHPIRVRWGECDAQGIVFNVNYFLYFDVAMTEYFRNHGYEGDDMASFYTAHAEADYRGSATFDEIIDVGVRCARIGRTSVTIEYLISRDGQTLTEGHMVYVYIDPGSQRSAKLPEAFIDKITAYEKTSPVINAIA